MSYLPSNPPRGPLTVGALVRPDLRAPFFSANVLVRTVIERAGGVLTEEIPSSAERQAVLDFGYGVFIGGAKGCEHVTPLELLRSQSHPAFRTLRLDDLARRPVPMLRASVGLDEAHHQMTLSGLSAVPVAMPEGWFALLTATQILEAQAAQIADLSERLRQNSDVLTTLSQAVRSPLAAIECQCELIRWQFAHSPYLQEKQKRIRTSCGEISRALTHVANEQSASPHAPIETKRVHLPRYLNKLAAELQAVASNRGVAMVLDVSTAIDVAIDGERLKRAVVHLVSEFVNASAVAASLTLVTWFEADGSQPTANGEQGGSCGLQLTGALKSDKAGGPDGRGLSAQLNHSLETSLAHVRSVVEMHGGFFEHEISAANASLVIRLPHARLTPPPLAATRKLVVVVDDDVELQEFLCTTLERHGYRVIGVNDGFDALIAIERYRPDIVVTDVIMPNMDGLDLTSRIKRTMAVPVILVTGYYKDLADLKRSDFKPDMILPKPLEQEKIVAAIEELTARKHLVLVQRSKDTALPE